MDDVGARVVRIIGEPAARELLEGLETADDIDGVALRAQLAGVLRERTARAWLASLLEELRGDAGEAARLRLVEALQQVLGQP